MYSLLYVFKYYRKAVYTQNFLSQLSAIFRRELRYPLKELLKTEKGYYMLCLEETLRGEANLTPELMQEMTQVRRIFLYLREIHKYFTLEEGLDIDVDRECYSAVSEPSSLSAHTLTQPQSFSGRRLESFHVVGELTELCRCFECNGPVPVKVYLRVCPSIPNIIQTDKELLVTFLVNVMFQSLSNIVSYPRVYPKSADRLHEIVILVCKRSIDKESSRSNKFRMNGNLRYDSMLDVRIMDTGLNNVLTKCGLLAGEVLRTDGGIRWTDGSRNFECRGVNEANRKSNVWSTVYIQLQEYMFRRVVHSVGGSFERNSVSRMNSSYRNEVFVSLPMYSNVDDSRTSLRLPKRTLSSALFVIAEEFSHYCDVAHYYNIIYDKLAW